MTRNDDAHEDARWYLRRVSSDVSPPRWRLLNRYRSLVRADLSATYARTLHKWLLVAPLIGLCVGLFITLLTQAVLVVVWPAALRLYLAHHWLMVPGVTLGFVLAGVVMQRFTPNPDEHSTEEVIRSYHHHQGHMQLRPFAPKIFGAITSVGLGGSAALEGPSIYGGGAIGSWLWRRLRPVKALRLSAEDRRIMLISGAAAGMAAVFRAPLTGLVFALEMPYKDDLAHEALLPSLISSVVSYATMAALIGAEPLFSFGPEAPFQFTRVDLAWCAALGALCGVGAMAFAITFRHFRQFSVSLRVPHWLKMALGGLLTGLCGLVFVSLFPGDLVPLGPNYEAAPALLLGHHGVGFLVAFAAFKLAATLFSLGTGGVSAMFVPLFLSGAAFGLVFAETLGMPMPGLYAAAGMAAFIAAAYKAPMTAVVFIAESSGGHAFLIPSLIAAATAYAVSGEASASGEQRLHERLRPGPLEALPVYRLMEQNVVAFDAASTLEAFARAVEAAPAHAIYPVLRDGAMVGALTLNALVKRPPDAWARTQVREVMSTAVERVPPDCPSDEALRRLTRQHGALVLWVGEAGGRMQGLVTRGALLEALGRSARSEADAVAVA